MQLISWAACPWCAHLNCVTLMSVLLLNLLGIRYVYICVVHCQHGQHAWNIRGISMKFSQSFEEVFRNIFLEYSWTYFEKNSSKCKKFSHFQPIQWSKLQGYQHFFRNHTYESMTVLIQKSMKKYDKFGEKIPKSMKIYDNFGKKILKVWNVWQFSFRKISNN